MTQQQITEQVSRHERLSRKHRDAVRELQRVCKHPGASWKPSPCAAYSVTAEVYICPDCHYMNSRTTPTEYDY